MDLLKKEHDCVLKRSVTRKKAEEKLASQEDIHRGGNKIIK